MDRRQRAVQCYRSEFNCAQSVLSVFADDFGLDPETALRMACGLGAGMGRMAETCGAVTAAFMVLGLKFGMTDPERQEDKEKTYELVRRFCDRFRERNPSLLCRDLLGCDISTPAGFEEAKEANLMEKVCERVVGDAVEIIEEMIQDPGP
ncbi:MAG: C_GCAxxG_C_C family protein [bacterium]|nr:MAG: C_GCAxxG_C_C family protein [bacterium]